MAGKIDFSKDTVDLINPLLGIAFGIGSVWFIDSGHDNAKDDSGHGRARDKPFKSLKFAVGQVTGANGDVVFIAPGHSESLTASDAIHFQSSGVTIYGIGNGTDRPTFNFSGDTLADMEIDADNITIYNCYFDMTGIDAIAAGVDVNKSHFSLINCEVLMGDSGGQAIRAMDFTATADYAKVINCKFFTGLNAGALEAIVISAALTNIEIGYCWFDGDFSNGCLHSTAAFTEGLIHHCYLKNDSNLDNSINFTGNATGFLAYNLYINNKTQATGVDPGLMRSFECYHADTNDVNGILAPVAT